MANKRIIWIDFIRTVCVLYIVGIFHMNEYIRPDIAMPTTSMYYQTAYCVLATFTLISGFFVGNKALDSRHEIVDF